MIGSIWVNHSSPPYDHHRSANPPSHVGGHVAEAGERRLENRPREEALVEAWEAWPGVSA